MTLKGSLSTSPLVPMIYTYETKFTTVYEDISSGDEVDPYYTTDPSQYRQKVTVQYTVDDNYQFTLILYSHRAITDGDGGDMIKEFIGQWIGNILSTPYYFYDTIPPVEEYVDVLDKDPIYNEYWDLYYYASTQVNDKWFVPFEGHPVLV